MEPARPDTPAREDIYDDPGSYDDPGLYGDPRQTAFPVNGGEPCVGPTAALRGRAGGPGFEVPYEADEKPGPAEDQSGWQRALGVWSGSGVNWERPPASGPVPEPEPAPVPEPIWSGYQEAVPVPAFVAAQAFLSAPTMADAPPAYVSPPEYPSEFVYPSETGYSPTAYPPSATYQPATAYPPDTEYEPGYEPGYAPEYRPARPDWTRPDSVVPGTRVRTGAADEMFRAWDSSVREASDESGSERPGRNVIMPRGTAPRGTVPRGAVPQDPTPRDLERRRRLAWQAARVGVPVAVIVTVGAGAVLMLTGQSGENVADQADQGASATRQTPASSAANSVAVGAGSGAFTGYPGEHGLVTVDSSSTAGSAQVAVGAADGHPAIWHRAANGTWSLVPASVLAAYQAPDTGSFTSIAHGQAGWIAVGEDVSGTSSVPVLVTSADGVTWHVMTGTAAFSGSAVHVSAVASGTDGFVVVGQETHDGHQFAAMWWSPDLSHWTGANNGGLDGRLTSSDATGVTATASGFAAVGSHGGSPMIWTSSAGLSWTPLSFGNPVNASLATLLFVAANGGRIVAAGNATLAHGGNAPFVMVSSDGGRNWQQILLPATDGLGTVTSLTTDSDGFTVAGQTGSAKSQHSVTWTSTNGTTWSAPANDGA